MRGQPAVAWSRPGMRSAARLRGHLIQRFQQAKPAGEADLLLCAGVVSLPEIADDPKTARRRLGPVQEYADLHTPMVPGSSGREHQPAG